jgi:hypothetical protein
MGDRAKIEAKQNRTDCLKMSFKAFGYIFAVRQNTNDLESGFSYQNLSLV